jgi:AbiV family abortive infection protein
MKQRLPQYRGVLTSAQIAEGMNAANRNSKRLASDARLMLEQVRHSSAVGLSILAIEESGKLTILRELALARNANELNRAWREYRQHTSKNQLWLLIDSALKGASKLRDFGHLFDPGSEHPQILDQLKQVSLYTDCLDNGHWSIPDEVIDFDLAKMLVGIAEILSYSHEVTTQEVELWILHIQPVYKTTREAMEQALIAWDREMRSCGLLKDRSSTMEDFITRGIDISANVRNSSDGSNSR